MTQCEKCIHQKVCRARDCHDEDDIGVVTYCSNFMPIVEVVGLVRCKECRLAHESIMIDGWFECENNEMTHKPDHYCSYGERKEK